MQDDRKAHQITLQELGIIPKEPKRKEEVRKQYAFPCGGCICNHCANNLYSEDKTAGEAKIFCDACEWCRWYDGDTKNPDKWKQECDEYIITEEQAKRNRKKFKIVK